MSPALVVLNTRPREQAAELSDLLSQAGFEPVEVPAIEIEPAWEPSELESARQNLNAGRYDWVVLASQNAGTFIKDELRGSRIVCGAATARALGVTSELALRRFSASAALHVLRPLVRPGQHMLVPRAAQGRDELIDGLRTLGATVEAPVAYRMVFVDAANLAQAAARLRAHEVAALTVCSPSAVGSLMRGIGPLALAQTVLACLGDTTAGAAREVGLRVDAVADKTTMESLVLAVRGALDGASPVGEAMT